MSEPDANLGFEPHVNGTEQFHGQPTEIDQSPALFIVPGEQAAVEPETPESSNRLRRAMHLGKRAVEGTLLSLALNPITNEGSRLAVAGAVQVVSRNPALTALAWGGSTLVIESTAAVVTADLLTSEKAPKTMGFINKILGKIGVKEETKFNPVVKAGISYLAGSGVATAVEHREDMSRTREQNTKYGLKNAAVLAGVCSVQGYMVAEGFANPDPLTIGGAVIGVGSVFGIMKWAKNKIRASQEKPEPGSTVVAAEAE